MSKLIPLVKTKTFHYGERFSFCRGERITHLTRDPVLVCGKSKPFTIALQFRILNFQNLQ